MSNHQVTVRSRSASDESIQGGPGTYPDDQSGRLKEKDGGKRDLKEKVQVPVPPGYQPGDKLVLSIHGRKTVTHIPKDKYEGDTFTVLPPQHDDHDPRSDPHKIKTVRVAVPKEAQIGQPWTFELEGRHGKKACVIIPEGIKPGHDTIELDLFHDYDKHPNKPKQGNRDRRKKNKSRDGGRKSPRGSKDKGGDAKYRASGGGHDFEVSHDRGQR